MDLSNKTLAFIVFFTILLSVFSTMSTLNRISRSQIQNFPVSGKAYSDQATVQLQVSSEIGIILLNDTVDFGSGYVNDSCPVQNINNATLVAGQVYSDTNGSDCWTGTTSPTSLHIENIGNNDILLKVLGPTNASFFAQGATAYPGTNPYLINFRAWKYEANACDDNGALQATWIDFAGTNRTICSNFTFSPTRDELAIDIMVWIPRDLPSGTYQNSTITFMATTS